MLARIPAKGLPDLELDEQYYKADFDLATRYDSLSKEVERLALLGIGAYGFMLSAIKENDTTYSLALKAHPRMSLLPALGLISLAVAAGCALSCAYINSRCLKLQVDILRYLRRTNDDDRWPKEQQDTNREFLAADRRRQAQLLGRGRFLAFAATFALICGASLAALAFILVIFIKAGYFGKLTQLM